MSLSLSPLDILSIINFYLLAVPKWLRLFWAAPKSKSYAIAQSRVPPPRENNNVKSMAFLIKWRKTLFVKQIPLFLSLPNKEAYSHSIIKETWPIHRLKPLSFHSCSLSALFSFFPYRGSFLHRFPILSPAYQSHTSLSILVSYRLIRSSFFSSKNTIFFSRILFSSGLIRCTRRLWAWSSALAEYYPQYSVSKPCKKVIRILSKHYQKIWSEY